MINEAIALIARETGWSLEYIRSQPISYIQALLNEINFQKSLDVYQQAYNSAMIVCALVNDKTKHYKPEDIIGEHPERRAMTNESTLAQSPKFGSITLGDGKEYQLAPLNVNMMAGIEEKFDKSMSELFSGSVRMKVLRALLFARLQAGCPDMTEEKLGELITDDVLVAMKTKLAT
jgi:hypothetical protein